MFVVELLVVLLEIWLGARLGGGIDIGFAGGMGVLILTLGFGLPPGVIPFDVIEIIMAVIAATAAMQVAGGMGYLVSLAERLLRRHTRHVTLLAPLVTYLMTLLAGTGHTAFSTLLEPCGISYITLLAIAIPSTMVGLFLAVLVINFLGKELKDDEVYQARLAKDEVTLRDASVGLIANPPLSRNEAIVVFMLTIATLISLSCKLDTGEILSASTFKSGMGACICVMGVA